MQSTIRRVKNATLAMQRYPWEQGVVAQAFLEAGDADIAILMAIEAASRQIEDGRCAQMGTPETITDPCAIGEALRFAAAETGDIKLKSALEKLENWALRLAPRNDRGIVYHMMGVRQFWVDSFYMLPPFLACMGHCDEALKQIDGLWDALFLEKKSLLAHMWQDDEQRFEREAVWATGNGWAAAGMARVITLLPKAYAAQREGLIGRVKTILEAALKYQREDGLFHDVLDDPTTFVEVNVAQMLAYTIFRGIHEGYLEETYLPAAQRIYEAATIKVDAYGLVQQVCAAPHFNSPGTSPEGQAFYILMHAWREKGGFDKEK